MSVIIWPIDLPQITQQSGFSQNFADGRLLTKTDIGPGKRRLRWSGMQEVSCSLPLEGDHKRKAFASFWRDTTLGGVLPFFIPDQTEDGLFLTTSDDILLTTADDIQLTVAAWWLAQFGTSPPQIAPMGGIWYNATFSLQVLP